MRSIFVMSESKTRMQLSVGEASTAKARRCEEPKLPQDLNIIWKRRSNTINRCVGVMLLIESATCCKDYKHFKNYYYENNF